MSIQLIQKLLQIYNCIETSCESSVKIFNKKKGHSSKSVGFAAYEERQQMLLDLSISFPETIEFLCKKGGHHYFKFQGRTIKIISSTRDVLGKNVFDRNKVELANEEFDNFDPLVRIIYKTDYDLLDNSATLLECYYLEIDRNSHKIINEINLMRLAQNPDSLITKVTVERTESVDLPAGELMFKQQVDVNISNDNDE